MLKDSAKKAGQSIEAPAVAFVKTNRPRSIIQRTATPAEVANMVVYACSPQASAGAFGSSHIWKSYRATNGAALRVDGGVVDTIA
jgi:hypothetical protein